MKIRDIAAVGRVRGVPVPGRDLPQPVFADYLSASPEYFTVMGIPVLAGRGISEADRQCSAFSPVPAPRSTHTPVITRFLGD